MPLRALEPDPEIIDVITSRLSELVGRPEFRDRTISRANPLSLALAVPHEVFTLGLDELAAGASVAASKPIAQRFLVFDKSTPVASVEVSTADPGGFMLTEGPYVDGTARAVESADRREDVADAVVRLLRVPALYLVALWLHASGGRDDVFIPLEPAPAPLVVGRSYSTDGLSIELRRMASRRLDGRPDTGG